VPRTSKTPPPPPPGYVYSDEAARRLSVSVKTLWNYRHLRKGPEGLRYRGRLIYSEDEIDAHVAAELDALRAQSAERAHQLRPAEPRVTRRQPAHAA
jgi:hypothetical protein